MEKKLFPFEDTFNIIPCNFGYENIVDGILTHTWLVNLPSRNIYTSKTLSNFIMGLGEIELQDIPMELEKASIRVEVQYLPNKIEEMTGMHGMMGSYYAGFGTTFKL